LALGEFVRSVMDALKLIRDCSGPGDVRRVAQFDERVIPVEVAECFRV
jgi:hypothetical protein